MDGRAFFLFWLLSHQYNADYLSITQYCNHAKWVNICRVLWKWTSSFWCCYFYPSPFFWEWSLLMFLLKSRHLYPTCCALSDDSFFHWEWFLFLSFLGKIQIRDLWGDSLLQLRITWIRYPSAVPLEKL